jgi:uncharacterized protein with ATP-grasp and redox domains
LQVGIDRVADFMSSGTNISGAVLETCSLEFKKAYMQAGLVISKGQGNYEALSEESRPTFFLLMVKCNVFAQHMGAMKGNIVLKGINIAS